MSWILTCSGCGFSGEATRAMWCCPQCGRPLEWQTERRFTRDMIAAGQIGLWRYEHSLPIQRSDAWSLGEITTPLIEVAGAHDRISAKLDYFAPSGSYKDRGAAVMVAALKHLGATHAVEDSSGNAAAAISAYAAACQLQCTVFAPAAASPGKLVQSRAYGARVVPVTGSRDDVAVAAMTAAAEIPGATYASHNWHPFFIEGVKTWAFEVWEQLGFAAPDVVVAPVGSGSMILGAYLAFSALRAGGEIDRLPRLFAAQPAACAPIAAALGMGATETSAFPKQPTLAEGASIANPVRGRELLAAIRATNGGAIAVEEEAIAAALRELAAKGIYVEPTSAVAYGGVKALRESGQIGADESTVIVLSGSGLKATESIGKLITQGNNALGHH